MENSDIMSVLIEAEAAMTVFRRPRRSPLGGAPDHQGRRDHRQGDQLGDALASDPHRIRRRGVSGYRRDCYD
jgi:hypothetical protein